jgi:hypothetical protein
LKFSVYHLIGKDDSWGKQIMDRKNIDRGFKKLRVWPARRCILLIQMLIIAYQGWMDSILAALLIRESPAWDCSLASQKT